MQSIVAIHSDPAKCNELTQLANKLKWYYPNPRDERDTLYFLSAARQGNTTVARLYFEARKGESGRARKGDGTKGSIKSPQFSSYALSKCERVFGDNIISVSLEFNQIPFTTMMIENDYLRIMEYVDSSLTDNKGRTALDRACEKNLVYIAKGIYSRYAPQRLDDASTKRLCERARKGGYSEIVNMFETTKQDVVSEDFGNQVKIHRMRTRSGM